MMLSIRKSKSDMASIGQRLRKKYDIPPRHTTRTHVERSACESTFLGHGQIKFLTNSSLPSIKILPFSHFSLSLIFIFFTLSPLLKLLVSSKLIPISNTILHYLLLCLK